MSSRPPAPTSLSNHTQRRGRQLLGGLFFFIICVLVVDALVGDQGLVATMRARKRYDQLAADLARLRSENAGLREEARRLKDDPAAVEEIARRELGLMSPGEQLFIIKDIDPPASR